MMLPNFLHRLTATTNKSGTLTADGHTNDNLPPNNDTENCQQRRLWFCIEVEAQRLLTHKHRRYLTLLNLNCDLTPEAKLQPHAHVELEMEEKTL
jgi:hypothetical protein